MLKTKDSWDKLSMYEKADLIKYAVQNGIYNPNTVRQAYNEHADGGRMKSNDSVTLMQQPMQIDRILVQWVNNLTEQKRNHDARLFALGGNIGDDDDTVTIDGVTYSKEPKKINPGTFDWNYATYLPSGEVLDTKTGNYGPVLLNEVIKTAPFVRKPLSIEDYANKARRDYLTVSNDATIVNPTWNAEFRGKPINPHLKDRAEHGAKSNALWEKEHPVLSTLGTVASAVPFAVASYPLWGTAATAGADALAATKFGQAGIGLANTIKAGAASSPWWPWVEQGINSLFAADAVDKWSKGQVDAESIVEGLPLLGPVAKSAEMAANAANRGYEAARNWYDLATIAKDVNKGIKADRGSTIAGLNNDAAKTLIQAEESWASSLPRARDYSITRVEPYSGYTPTNQSAAYQNFVDDVEQGVSWGRNRGVAANPTRNTDFGNGVPDLKPVGSGAEARVMEDPNDPSRVLKFSTDYGLSARTQAEALKNAEQFASKRNMAPYNMPLSVEGTYENYGSFYPVFSQGRVVPIGSENAYTVSGKLGELNNSVNGSGWYPGPIRTNSILSENDIARTLDFKPENLGITEDGSLVGIDLGVDYRGPILPLEHSAGNSSEGLVAAAVDDNFSSQSTRSWNDFYRGFNEATLRDALNGRGEFIKTNRGPFTQDIRNVEPKDIGFSSTIKIDPDKRFMFFEPGKFINYDIGAMSEEEIINTFGPEAAYYKKLYDVAKAHNFEGKYEQIGKDAEFNILNRFAISKSDPDVARGLEEARSIYSIPEYRARFERKGGIGEAFIEDALSRLDNIKLQGRGKNVPIKGQFGVPGGAYTSSHPTSPTVGLYNSDSSKIIYENVRHEANHAAHGTKFQPEWMRYHNEKIRPKLREGKTADRPIDKYYDEMDEIVERSKTAVEFADKMRKPNESLDSALERLADMADANIYDQNIPADIRQMMARFTKDSTLHFWKNFLGGVAATTIGTAAAKAGNNQSNER